MPNGLQQYKTAHISWLSTPDPAHSVHFYPSETGLINSLTDYFYEGLKADKTCVAISTTGHLVKLNSELRNKGIDVMGAVEKQQYIMLDAQDTLKSFMVNNLPNYNQFLSAIKGVLSIAEGRGKPVLAFGEMVALLWEEGNSEGLLQLEKFWHELISKSPFSLYCAYPKKMFKKSDTHQSIIDKICNCHSLTLTTRSPKTLEI